MNSSTKPKRNAPELTTADRPVSRFCPNSKYPSRTEEDFFSRSVTGVMVNYFHVCHTELWYFAHDINMSFDSEIVHLGRLITEEFYTRSEKEISIFENIRIDRITPDGLVHEVKKSDRALTAHIWQLKYYLWMLKEHGFGTLDGILEFPKQRKRISVTLTKEDEAELKKKLEKIVEIIRKPVPPKARKKPYCKHCSYREFCWS